MQILTASTNIIAGDVVADSVQVCDVIDQLTPGQTSERDGITVFANEACSSVTIRGASAKSVPTFTSYDEGLDIRSYLARPVVYSAGGFTNTTRGSIVTYNITWPSVFTLFPAWANKLNGAFGIRASLVFKLVLTANPFQAGRLRLVFQPEASARAAYISNYSKAATMTSWAASMLPGVELDINESTSCELKIPFIHHSDFFAVSLDANASTSRDAFREWGALSLISYLPYTAASGAPPPNWLLWVHLEDVEVIGAAPLQPNTSRVVPQSLEASATEKVGPVTDFLDRTRRVGRFLARNIPLLSSYGDQADWALRIARGVTSTYGWSKPVSTSPPVHQMPTVNTAQWNCDSVDLSHKAALTSTNHISPCNGFAGSGIDEMALSYVLSNWCQICTGTLLSSDSIEQLKYACVLSPSAMWFNTTANLPLTTAQLALANTAILPSPIHFLANTFAYWRGSFEFRFKIAKTKFHVGRLQFGFLPMASQTMSGFTGVVSPTLPYNTLDFHSAVWDLRESNEFTFVCPYTHPLSYLNTDITSGNPNNFGNLLMWVLDPLQGPSSVSQSVPFCVEVRACPDFEFAVPMGQAFPLAPSDTVVVAQSNESYPPGSGSDMVAQHCIGEKIQSVKQLISRSTYRFIGSGATSLRVLPCYDYSTFWPTGVSVPLLPICSYFATMYCYARGSTVIDLLISGAGYNTQPSYILTAQRDTRAALNDITIIDSNASGHIVLPYFGRNSRDLTSGITTLDVGSTVNYQINVPDATASWALSFRAGDDVQYGFFTGVPPLTISPSTPALEVTAANLILALIANS